MVRAVMLAVTMCLLGSTLASGQSYPPAAYPSSRDDSTAGQQSAFAAPRDRAYTGTEALESGRVGPYGNGSIGAYGNGAVDARGDPGSGARGGVCFGVNC